MLIFAQELVDERALPHVGSSVNTKANRAFGRDAAALSIMIWASASVSSSSSRSVSGSFEQELEDTIFQVIHADVVLGRRRHRVAPAELPSLSCACSPALPSTLASTSCTSFPEERRDARSSSSSRSEILAPVDDEEHEIDRLEILERGFGGELLELSASLVFCPRVHSLAVPELKAGQIGKLELVAFPLDCRAINVARDAGNHQARSPFFGRPCGCRASSCRHSGVRRSRLCGRRSALSRQFALP